MKRNRFPRASSLRFVLTQAILLAAGESTRMGTPKSTLDWFGKPLVVAQVESLLQAGVDSVVVVVGATVTPLERLLSGMPSVTLAENRDFKTGKASSVRTGAHSLDDRCDNVVLLAVDQPRPAWVVQRVLTCHAAARALITSPRYEGHGGHPLVFSASLRSELENVTDELEGVRAIMSRHAHAVNNIKFTSPIVRIDLNTSEEYRTALATYPSLSDEPAG